MFFPILLLWTISGGTRYASVPFYLCSRKYYWLTDFTWFAVDALETGEELPERCLNPFFPVICVGFAF